MTDVSGPSIDETVKRTRNGTIAGEEQYGVYRLKGTVPCIKK